MYSKSYRLIMSTITSDCHRLSDFLIVANFGAGFAMKVSSLDRIKFDCTTKCTKVTKNFLLMNSSLRALCVLRGEGLVLRVLAAAPDDGVYQRRLAVLDLCDCSLYCRADFGGIFDGTLGVPADPFGNMREIGRRAFEIHADIGARGIGAALMRHVNLMRPVVVIGAVVIHNDQHWNLILDRHPERAKIEHQVAVRLQVDDEFARALVRQSNTDRHADLSAGAKLAADVAIRPVEVPYFMDPLL